MSHLALVRKRQLFFVDDLAVPVLSDVDYRHGAKSLRLKEGAAITLSDGVGNWVEARFAPEPELVHEPTFSERSATITVCFTPVKNVRPDFIVQKLTELGVARIIPLITQRSVVRWDERKASKNYEKFCLVAREAAMQSRTLYIPTIEPVTLLSSLAMSTVVLADPEGRQITAEDRSICIGPEGGFSDDEKAAGELVALPGNILRAETAAITAAAIAQHIGHL